MKNKMFWQSSCVAAGTAVTFCIFLCRMPDLNDFLKSISFYVLKKWANSAGSVFKWIYFKGKSKEETYYACTSLRACSLSSSLLVDPAMKS